MHVFGVTAHFVQKSILNLSLVLAFIFTSTLMIFTNCCMSKWLLFSYPHPVSTALSPMYVIHLE